MSILLVCITNFPNDFIILPFYLPLGGRTK